MSEASLPRPPPLPVGVTVVVDVPPSAPREARTVITCFRCGETGHRRIDCYSYRVALCPTALSNGACYTPNCMHAHSVEELRSPCTPKCVRVVKNAGRVQILGCGRTGHTFRCCPFQE